MDATSDSHEDGNDDGSGRRAHRGPPAVMTSPSAAPPTALLYGWPRRIVDGDNRPASVRADRWVVVAFLTVGSLVALLRIPRATWGTFYAEDGRTFVGQWLSRPAVSTLFREYAGYQHFLPRVTAFLAQMLPIGQWALAMTALASLCVGACGALSYLATRSVPLNRSLRLTVGAIPILSPLTGFEALGSAANLHWYMTYVLLWVFLVVPRTGRGALGWALVAAAAALTEPQTLLLAPLAVIQLYRTRGKTWPVSLGWCVGFLGQGLTYLAHPLVRVIDFHDAGSAVFGFVVNGAGGTVFDTGTEIGFVVTRSHWVIPVLWALLLVFAAVFSAVWCRGELRLATIFGLFAALASWSAAYFLNDHGMFEYQNMSVDTLADVPLIRWGTSAAMLLPVGVIVLLQAAHDRWGKVVWLPVAGSVAIVLTMIVGGFQSTESRRGGPNWRVEITASRSMCAADPSKSIKVQSFPPGWQVTVPCRLIN